MLQKKVTGKVCYNKFDINMQGKNCKARKICIYSNELNDYSSILKIILSYSWILLKSFRIHLRFPSLWVETKHIVFDFKEFLLFHIHQVYGQPHQTCPRLSNPRFGHSILQTGFLTFHLWFNSNNKKYSWFFFLHLQSIISWIYKFST